MQDARPLLSIGLIVKDEEARLGRCLKALEPLRQAIACQVVVADTGFSDNSRAIAEEYADIVIDFPWIGDFAAARNAVMDQCSGVWFLSVDADEYLDPDFGDLLTFLQDPENADCEFASITVRNYKNELYGSAFNDLYAVRMTRMDTGNRYFGSIHESFQIYADSKRKILPHVIFHHDGYSVIDPQRLLKKRDRNMELLIKELRHAPNDTRRIVQCIESASDSKTALKYVKRGLRVIREGKSKRPAIDPIIYRYAVVLEAPDSDDPEGLEKTLEEGLERSPESIYLRVDGQGGCLVCCYRNERYEAAVEHGLAWEAGLDAYDREDFDLEELTYSTLNFQHTASQNRLRSMLLQCQLELERWEDAETTFSKLDLATMDDQEWTGDITLLLRNLDHMANGREELQRVWQASERLAEAGEGNWKERRVSLYKALASVFSPTMLDAYETRCLIAELSGEAGRSAQILLSQDAEKIRGILEQVERWEEVFLPVYPHVMSLGIDFPDTFFRPSRELARLASSISGETTDFTGAVLTCARLDKPWSTPIRLTWLLDVVGSAIQSEKWENIGQCQELCDIFVRVTRAYLKEVYAPSIPTEENLYVLPDLHRFGWYCVQADMSMEQGDRVGYLRLLRKGLETVPVMKGMVDFLAKQLEEKEHKDAIAEASPELMDLAKQVKALISQMPAGDPAVQMLKQSEAYQKVAFLMEEPAISWPM